MRQLPRPWEARTDPDEREALAARQLDLALALKGDPMWVQLTGVLGAQVQSTLNDLARSQKDDEQNRGVIRALNHVLSMPDNLIEAASTELDKHR